VPDQAETILFGVEGHLPSPPHIIACGPGTQAAKSLNYIVQGADTVSVTECNMETSILR